VNLVWVLDVVLVLILIASLVYGYRSGLLRSVSTIVGVAAGGVAAVFAIPFVGTLVPTPEWRGPASLGTAVLLLLGGFAIGQALGHSLQRSVTKRPLRIVDRMLGAGVNLVVTALVTSVVAFGLGSMGVPFLAQPVASSAVLRTIDDLAPDPVTAFLAQVRSLVLQDGIPRIVDALDGTPPAVPQFDTGTPALTSAARSVVRITGNAFACGQNQSGSGFLVAPDRVLTNAHVVAGVDEPVVESAADGAKIGEIVYFDPVGDLAVIAVDGLTTPVLEFGPELPAGADAVVDGYPFGGPFRSHPALIVSSGQIDVPDIYGERSTPRPVYTLAADVQQGESGGPLLAEDGSVAGVIFAKGATTADIGYAMTADAALPVVQQAEAFTAPVASGSCIRG
jgi:S1-C subfamily serine protease